MEWPLVIPEQFTAIGPPQLYLKGRGEGQKNCGGTLFPDNTASLDQRFKHFPANTVLLGEQCDLCCYQTAKARTLCVYLTIWDGLSSTIDACVPNVAGSGARFILEQHN